MSIYIIIGAMLILVSAIIGIGAFCENAGRKSAWKKAEEAQKEYEKNAEIEQQRKNTEKESMETGSGQSDFNASISILHHDKTAGN